MKKIICLTAMCAVLVMSGCGESATPEKKFDGSKGEVTLLTLDPGHFHAALVQMYMYDQVSPEVYVYAPDAADNRGARVGQTAEDGTLAVDLYQVGVDSSCSLWLVDADGNQNGGSYTSKSVHINGFNSVVTTAMSEK